MTKTKTENTRPIKRDKAGTVIDESAANEVCGRSELMRRQAVAKKSEAKAGAGKGDQSSPGKAG